MRPLETVIAGLILGSLIICALVWQHAMYQECRKDGHSLVFCMLMTSKGQYAIIDLFQDHN